jgi:hypothetical protein
MGKEERKVEDHLKDRVEALGGFTRKYKSPGRRGVPDELVFLPRRFFLVECKTEIGDLSKLQALEINRINMLQIPCFVCSSKQDVDYLMDNLQANVPRIGAL